MDERISLEVSLATEHIVSAIRQRLPGREPPLLVALGCGGGHEQIHPRIHHRKGSGGNRHRGRRLLCGRMHAG